MSKTTLALATTIILSSVRNIRRLEQANCFDGGTSFAMRRRRYEAQCSD
jgi:hypothetical protein